MTEFETSKVQALLAYLAVEADRPHHRTTLATLLWPNHPELAARTNLRQVLHHLRHTLGERDGGRETGDKEERRGRYLIVTRNTIGFNAQSSYLLDVAGFSTFLGKAPLIPSQAIDASRIEQLSRAAELYRGDFLAGFHIQDGELFEEWLGLQREHYHRQALDLFVYLTAYHEAAGNLARAEYFATRQIELEPWREEAHRHLMLLLARNNQRSAALAQYEQCRLQLAKELGVEPSAETTQIYEQIRAGRWSDNAPGEHAPAALAAMNGAAKAASLSPGLLPGALPAADRQRNGHPPSFQDWGEAPHVAHFYGRDRDQASLRHWLTDAQAHVIMVLGMGGIGKTALVAQTVKTLAADFEFVFWRSLLNAPPLKSFLGECLRFFSRQQIGSLPESSHEQINLLFDYLRAHRCLLVLDNLESILEADTTSQFRPGYEGYGYLLDLVGQSEHRSSLILTSRERPYGVERLEGNGWVHFLLLSGLEDAAGQNLLETRGLAGNAKAGATLVRRYSGNPLALKLVARTIEEFFDGDIAAFLSDELPIFDDIRTVLEQHFARLTALERELLIWMAIEREPVALPHVASNLVRAPSRSELLSALRALQRRSLLEKTDNGFILQNVVTEYITDDLIGHICQEIEQGQIDRLHRYALLQAQAMEYVRQSQAHLMMAPVVRRLLATLGQAPLQSRMQMILNRLRADPILATGYAAGNLLNLLLHMGAEMQGYDFSRLVIRQANLRGVNLPAVDFTGATFHNSFFTDTFEVVRVLACSPDGRYLVAGTSDGEIRLWQLGDGQTLVHHQAHASRVNAVAFRPAGDLFASASSDLTVRLWDTAGGKLRQTLVGHTEAVNAIAFSADGQWLASAGNDQSIRLWHVESGALHQILGQISGQIPGQIPGQSLDQPLGTVRALAFHPQQPILAAGNNQIHLWNLRIGQPFQSLNGHTAAVTALAYDPDGRYLASSSADGTVRLWHTSDGALCAVLRGHESEVRCLAFAAGGRMLASGSADYTIRLWDIEVAERTEMIQPGAIQQGAPPNGVTQATSRDIPLYTLYGHVKGVNSVAFVPQSETLVSSGDDQTLRFWNLRNGNSRDVWFGHSNWVRMVLFSPTGSMLVSCDDDTFVRVWDVPTGELRYLLAGHRHWVLSLAFSPDGRWLASGGADHQLFIWNAQTGKLHHHLRRHEDTVRVLAFNSHGDLLASGGADHLVHLWEPSSGRLIRTLHGHTGWIQTLAFSPDGRLLATAGNDQRMCLWRMDDPSAVATAPWQTLTAQQGAILSVVFSPDGSLLASAGDAATICLWESSTGQLRHTLKGHESGVNSIAFSPDGHMLISASSDATVRVWDVNSGVALHILRGHSAWVRAVACSPDGKFIASSSADHTICLWDTVTGELLQTLRGHQHWVWTLAFRPLQPGEAAPSLLASGCVDGTARLWEIASGRCRAVLQPLGPYAGMKITGVMGISEAQKATLMQLGAVES